MKNGFKVFDADAHVVYPADLWDRFLDKRFRHRVGRRAPAGPRHLQPRDRRRALDAAPHLAVRPVPEGHQLDHRRHDRQVRRGDGDAGLHRRSRRQGPGGRGRRHHGHLRAGVRPVDRRHRSRVAGSDGARLQPLGRRRCGRAPAGACTPPAPVPLQDVSRAIEEIQYAYDELGMRCFWARNNHFNHRNLGDRYYDPIWELLQDLDVAFGTHEFMGLNGSVRGVRPLLQLHRVAHGRAPAGSDERRRLDDHQRRLRALPAAAGRVHGSRLRLAPVVAAPARRAPRDRRPSASSRS